MMVGFCGWGWELWDFGGCWVCAPPTVRRYTVGRGQWGSDWEGRGGAAAIVIVLGGHWDLNDQWTDCFTDYHSFEELAVNRLTLNLFLIYNFGSLCFLSVMLSEQTEFHHPSENCFHSGHWKDVLQRLYRRAKKSLFGKNRIVPFATLFCCEKSVLSVLKHKAKGHFYGRTEWKPLYPKQDLRRSLFLLLFFTFLFFL